MINEQDEEFGKTESKTRHRQLQISRIWKEVSAAHRRISAEHEPEVMLLNELGSPSPFLISEEKRAEIVSGAIEGAKVLHAKDIIGHVLYLLKNAIAQDSPFVSDIPLKGNSSPRVLRTLEDTFRNEQQILHAALAESERIAVGIILENFQKEGIPLLEYPKRVLSLRIELQPTVNGGSFACLPTKVDGIFVRYFYPRGQESPVMSLEVKRLE